VIFLKLYLDYISKEDEKEKIKTVLKLNGIKNNEIKKKQYSNNLFKDKSKSLNTSSNNTQLQVIKKENFFRRLINWIKKKF